jgi:hypothetical protein
LWNNREEWFVKSMLVESMLLIERAPTPCAYKRKYQHNRIAVRINKLEMLLLLLGCSIALRGYSTEHLN